MICIKTERGWRPLQVAVKPIEAAPPRYRGELPSPELKRYVAGLDAAHAEWVARRQAGKKEQA